MYLQIPRSTHPSQLGIEINGILKAGYPFVHIQQLPFPLMGEEERASYISEVCMAVGRLTVTSGMPGSALWRLDNTTSPNCSFIPYHTDNPFRKNPEGVVSFWNLHSSRQGGENLILPVHDLIEWAHDNPLGLDLLHQVMTREVSFEHDGQSAAGKMIDEDEKTARFDMKYIDPTSRQLGASLQNLLNETGLPSKSVKLVQGDVLFFNNRSTLHARSEYEDLGRVSIRVRMETDAT